MTVPGSAARAAGDALLSGMSRSWVTRMLGVVRRLGSAADLQEALERITEGVVEVLGFEAAAINVVRPDGSLEVAAVTGPADLAGALLGSVGSRHSWDRLLAGGVPWGTLVFVPGESQDAGTDLARWTRSGKAVDHPDAWQPEDSLFAPLLDRAGELLGVLSVDDPVGGHRPDMEQRTLLELFAAEAANALSDALRRALLADRETVFHRVFAEAPVPMVITDDKVQVVHANNAFGALVGIDPQRIVAERLTRTLLDPDEGGELVAACKQVVGGESDDLTVEHRLLRPDGAVRLVRSTASRVPTEATGHRLVVRVEDVTDARASLEELRRLADHDALTGIPNRRIARRRLETLLSDTTAGPLVAALYCDLDGFKSVNDEMGHVAGDELLTLVARRMSRAMRPLDLLCREGGDEFLVICLVPDTEAAGAVALRCIESLSVPFRLRAGTASVGMCVGVATAAPGSGVSASDLLGEADSALYRAKGRGRGRWELAAG